MPSFWGRRPARARPGDPLARGRASVQLRPLPPSSPRADSALFLPRGQDSIQPGGARSRRGPSRELSWGPPQGTETRRGLCQVRTNTRAHGLTRRDTETCLKASLPPVSEFADSGHLLRQLAVTLSYLRCLSSPPPPPATWEPAEQTAFLCGDSRAKPGCWHQPAG